MGGLGENGRYRGEGTRPRGGDERPCVPTPPSLHQETGEESVLGRGVSRGGTDDVEKVEASLGQRLHLENGLQVRWSLGTLVLTWTRAGTGMWTIGRHTGWTDYQRGDEEEDSVFGLIRSPRGRRVRGGCGWETG